MASLATTEKCPICFQVTNQGQQLYGPICSNGHRAHLDCIMKQFEHTGSFNIDSWTCPLCRAPAFHDPNSGTPSLNDALRRRYPRRIAKLEESEYSSEEEIDMEEETDMEEESDDSQGAFDAYAEELPANEPQSTHQRIRQLITNFPFLGDEYRPNEEIYIDSIMDGLTADVSMNGVFDETAQFQNNTAANMADILLTQWYNMYNIATANEDVRNEYRTGYGMDQVHNEVTMIEQAHSSISNQSPFFRGLTMAILQGHARGFWNLDREQVLLLTDMRRRAAQSPHTGPWGGRRKKKTRRKRRRGGVGTPPPTPRKKPHEKPPLPLKKPKITFWESMLPEDSKEEEIALNVMQELTSRELGDEGVEAEKEILSVLKYHLNDYKKIPENEQDPEFKKKLEKDITIFQNYVNNQTGGKRRKKKTRKKRGGLDSFPIGMLDQLSQDTIYNHPQKDDLIRRLNHIWNILGEDQEDQEAFKDLIRRNPNSFYQLIIHFIQQAEAEHHGGRRKKKKTRKKRGGNIEEVNRQLRLLNQAMLANNTRLQELEQWQEAFEDMELEERIMTLENELMELEQRIMTLESQRRLGALWDAAGGGKRKKKTRKKRGGMDEQPTPPQVPRDNDVGTKQYEPGQLGVQQPPQLPHFLLPPPANTEPVVRNRRAAIRMEWAPPHMRRSEDESAMLAYRANERDRRRGRNYLRNLSGDIMERCTGSRCGLGGGRRKKKTRKKKNRKRRTKKKSRRRKKR